MSVNELLKKLAVRLERKQDALFSYDVPKQKKFIEKMGIPKDDIERSYKQYRCQMKFNGWLISMALDIASFPVALAYLVKYSKQIHIDTHKKNAVFFRDGKPENILPKTLITEFCEIEMSPLENMYITPTDKKYISEIIKRYPFSWHFILKCIIKIAKYRFAIMQYKPKAIIVCAEYSFTSSMLTDYCNKNNIIHINVMHGEKLYYMRDSFFRFDRCYVWDKYYINLLCELGADFKQFRIEVPESLVFKNCSIQKKVIDFTYYLGAESEDTLLILVSKLKYLKERGNSIAIRPHPRYSNIEQVKLLFNFASIEDTRKLSIEESLLRTNYAVSLYSTVLNQALHNDISIVIDDISNVKAYRKLKQLKYICLNREHFLLSEIINKV